MSEAKTAKELTEQVMKEFDLQDRAGQILRVIDEAYTSCASLADGLADCLQDRPEQQLLARTIASALRKLRSET